MQRRTIALSFTTLLTLSLIFLSNPINAQTTADEASQQDAVLLVTELSEHLADLIIHHKSNVQDPEKTKEYSIKIVRKMAEIIAECIQRIKMRKTTKSMVLHDEESMNELIEKIGLEIERRVAEFNL